MDPAALAGGLEAIEARLAGSDAERRAALLCTRELRAGGRRPRLQTLWFRRQRMLARAVEAAVGVAGSIVAASHPAVGLGLAGGALLVAALEMAGVPVLSLLTARRATQNVVAPPPADREGTVLLVVSAAADAPRDSVLARLDGRLRERLGAGPAASLVPGPLGVHLAALALVAMFSGLRLAGAAGVALGVAQLVPSAVLILLFGGFVDAATARPAEHASASGPAVAVALAPTLDARPPRHLDVEVLIAGAGYAGAPGARTYVRARRDVLPAEDVIVVHLGSRGGPVRVIARDGELLGTGLHPRLVELAAELAGPAALVESRDRSAARVARGAGWPALALEGDAPRLAELVLRLVARIDADVGARRDSVHEA